MADEQKAGSITLSASDVKTWLMILAMVLGPAGVNKLALSGVELQQQQQTDTAARTAERQAAIEAAVNAMKVTIEASIKEMKSTQERNGIDSASWQGEMRYRLEQVEKRVAESNDSKKGNK